MRKLRTLYLHALPSVNGRDAIRGRALLDRLRALSEETLLGHMVCTDDVYASVADPGFKSDLVSLSMLRDFQANVIYIEHGLVAGAVGEWKVPRDTAAGICQAGGVVIVADVDTNALRRYKPLYEDAGSFFNAFATFDPKDSSEPVHGSDSRRCWGGHAQVLCSPAKMTIDDWVRPIYEGIPEILVGLPVRLRQADVWVASCNSDSTGTLANDVWVDHVDACPFAAATQIGAGFAVLIAGRVTSDAWLDGCPYNTVWLTNIASFFSEAAAAERARRLTHRRSPHLLFLSHRSTDKPKVEPIAAAIKGAGVDIWIDKERLIPSQSLTAEIDRALDSMTHFVLFWSKECLDSTWVEPREVAGAIARLATKRIPLVVVRLDSTPVPESVADFLAINVAAESADAVAARIVETVKRLAAFS